MSYAPTLMTIQLPISKSIAQRQLMLAHINNKPYPDWCDIEELPQDVITLQQMLKNYDKGGNTFNANDNATAARFMLALLAATNGKKSHLDGSPQLRKRPMGQLINALCKAGVQIKCTRKEGFLPVKITGADLSGTVKLNDVISSQFVSAIKLIQLLPNVSIDLHTNCHSPYLKMTEKMIEGYQQPNSKSPAEKDWSAAAFWYEYLALHPEKHPEGLLLKDLSVKSLQGDKAVKDIFKPLGIKTRQTKEGVHITINKDVTKPSVLCVNFTSCTDLYPAVFTTCYKSGVRLDAIGTSSLYFKESNRIFAMAQLLTTTKEQMLMSFGDHRIAMALLCADYKVDDTDCIKKSYPQFMGQWNKINSL